MKKQLRIIIIVGIILLLLVGTIIFLLTLPDTQSDTTSEASSGATTLISQSSGNIEQINVKNSGGEYTLLLYSATVENSDNSTSNAASTPNTTTELIFTMQEHTQYILDQDKTDVLANECATLSAKKTINSKGKEDSEYGLDSPRATVKVRFTDGSEKTIYLGNDAPGDEGVYAKTDDSNKIYLVAKDSVSAMLVEKMQMFDKTILYELSDDDSLQGFTISGSGREKPFTLEYNTISAVSEYFITSPKRAVCETDAIKTFCDSTIFPFVADSVAAIDADDEQIKKFGFDAPYYSFDVKTKNITAKILVSKPDSKNDCYIMLDKSKIIYKIASSEIDFMSGDGSDFASSTILYPNISKVKFAAISYDSTKNQYTLTHKSKKNKDEKLVIDTTVQLSGKEIASNRFNEFLRNISILQKSSKAPKFDNKETPILTVEFTYEDNKGSDILKLYQKGDNAVIVVNDISLGTVDLKTANELKKDAKALSQNMDFESLIKDNENSDTSENTEASA